MNPATVNYVYSANDYKLTSTFKDAQGQELKAPVVDTKDYHIQDNYTTTAATIPGYSLVATPANQNGTLELGMSRLIMYTKKTIIRSLPLTKIRTVKN